MTRPTKKQIQDAVAKLKANPANPSIEKAKVGSKAVKNISGEMILKPYDHG